MAEGSNNVQDREKVTKKKSRKTLSKKDAHNSPEHKVAKRSPKKARSRKDIHSPSDTIRQSQPQKCLQQTHRSSSCLKGAMLTLLMIFDCAQFMLRSCNKCS